jgi:hypothetical protein
MREVLAWAALCCLSSTADDAVDVSLVEAWATERREERIARWLPTQPFNRTGFRLVPLVPQLERGFLLVATKAPVARLRSNNTIDDNLGAILRDVCATHYPARLVVRTPAEKLRAERLRPCPKIEVVALGKTDAPLARRAGALHLFQVAALAANLPLYKDGTLYLDNDVAIRRDRADALMGLFDEVAKRHKALGATKSHLCVPRGHRTADVPPGYCERNSGILFFAAANRSAALVREWHAELGEGTSAGHDQVALRKVLWRHQGDVFDVPLGIQCHGPHCDPCTRHHSSDDPPLLWHMRRDARVRWAQAHVSTRKGVSARSVCGFQP